MATKLEIKRGIGRPSNSSLSNDGGELAIDHQTLTLWSKETTAGAVARVGWSTSWRLTALTRWTPTSTAMASLSSIRACLLMTTQLISCTSICLWTGSEFLARLQRSKRPAVYRRGCRVQPLHQLAVDGVNEIGKYVVLADTGVWDAGASPDGQPQRPAAGAGCWPACTRYP